uniref:uncharacterized protein LOC120344877 n=1 Tax=Styela clava TaxID=7725 RepID=UPI001939B904|nr:uncharacterized protein LOC120344877 [Styela clava]
MNSTYSKLYGNYMVTTLEATTRQDNISTRDMTTNDITTVETSPNNDYLCEFAFNNEFCYWTEVQQDRKINYGRSAEMCNRGNADVAIMRSEEVYNKTIQIMRSKIMSLALNDTLIWIQLELNPDATIVTTPNDGFIKWYPGEPSGIGTGETNVGLLVNLQYHDILMQDGMLALRPSSYTNGVVCELPLIKLTQITTTNTNNKTSKSTAFSSSLFTSSIQTSVPSIVNSSSATLPGNQCEIWIGSRNLCFWTYFDDEQSVNYSQAEAICANANSTIAPIANENIYNKILVNMRSKFPFDMFVISMWINLNVNTTNGAIIGTSTNYTKWAIYQPRIGNEFTMYTNVFLQARLTTFAWWGEGMYNAPPTSNSNGVVCKR